jgi:hypothetical protein
LWDLWRQGLEPRVDDFLAQAGVRDPRQIVAVLLVDQAERFRLGQGIPAETYLNSFPMVRDDPELALDLIFAEYLLREDLGERPDPEEFLRRFPRDARALQLQIELRQAMQALDDPSGERSAGNATTGDYPGPSSGVDSQGFPVIPGYEVHAILGRGGMGVVYKARQISLNRLVALKTIRSASLASEDELRRFQNEAEAVATLDHPHIVPIFEVGNHHGQRYFSMKLIDGSSLHKKLADYRDQPIAAARLLKKAAEAVHHANQRGISTGTSSRPTSCSTSTVSHLSPTSAWRSESPVTASRRTAGRSWARRPTCPQNKRPDAAGP